MMQPIPANHFNDRRGGAPSIDPMFALLQQDPHLSPELSSETYWSLSVRSINAAANLALRGYEHAVSADIRLADLSLSLVISCRACNHPVSAQAAA